MSDSIRIGIYVDTSNLYHKIQRRFGAGSKLDYEQYLGKCQGDDRFISETIAYGMQINNEASGFISCLKMAGFRVKFKPPRIMTIGDREIKQCDWNVTIALDIVRVIDRLDVVVLGSSNTALVPLVRWIKERGVRVVILAAGVPNIFKEIADEVIEITEEYLEQEEEDEDVYSSELQDEEGIEGSSETG